MKILAALILLLSPLTMLAQTPYAALDGTTLTFYYDNLRNTRGGTKYGLNSGTNDPGWYTDGKYANVTNVVFDSSFRDARPTSTYCWFCDMTNLASISGMNEYLNTSDVTNMGCMFYYCSSLTSLDLSGFNTEKVTSMDWMFYECSSLKSLDVSNFNTAKVTSMYCMFAGCSKLESLDLSSFKTTKVTDMEGMFSTCSNLKTIYCDDNWNKMGLTSTQMFFGCTSLKGGNGTAYNSSYTNDATYAHPDVADNPGYFSVKEAYAVLSPDGKTLTFYYDGLKTSRTGTICDLNSGNNYPGWYGSRRNITTVVFDSSFKDARPTSTYCWFYDMDKLTSITDMKEYLNTSEVTNMGSMFYYCSSLTSLDLSGFNTEKVTDMGGMFTYCSKLTSLDVGSFNTEKVENMNNMFRNCSKLTTIYCDKDWNSSSDPVSNNMFTGCTNLKGGNGTAYNYQEVTATYAHPDAADNPGYFTTKAYAALSTDGNTLIFYCDNQRSTRGKTYDLNSGENSPDWYNDNSNANVTTIVFDSSFKDARPTSTFSWFAGMSALTSITGMNENLNTSEVTTMRSMFYFCSSLESLDVSGFNTAKVTTMRTMLYYCSGLTSLDVSGFNTANVTNMYGMFFGCSGLTTLDVSGFNTAKVTDMGTMFYFCSSLETLDLNGFNTAKVTDMESMFTGCVKLTSLDVSGFNTANVTNMYAMFCNCPSLTSLDLSSFNTASVTNMGAMFYTCSKLESLDLSGFNTAKVTNMEGMFEVCSSLVSLDLSGFNTKNVTNMDAMFFNCSSLTSLDLSGFNTENVTTMSEMFYYSSSLTTIICDNNWYRSGITSADMFYGCTSLKGGNGTVYNSSNVTATYAHPDAEGNPGYFTKFVLGDANGDGKVTITDAVAVVNYILNTTQGTFNVTAADVDGNGSITAVGIVNIILNSTSAGVKERSVREEIGSFREPE